MKQNRISGGRLQKYMDCAAQGLTRRETADKLGVTVGAVGYAARLHKLKFKPSKYGRPRKALTLPSPRVRLSVSAGAVSRFEAMQ